MIVIVQSLAYYDMDGALTFTHVCVDSSQTVLEHHRSFTPFIWLCEDYYSITLLRSTPHRLCEE